MAASAQGGPTRAQSAAPQALPGQEATRAPGSGREPADRHPLPLLVPGGGRGGWWEQSFPGNADQLTRLRAALDPLLTGTPLADDVILLMSELGGNAVRHSGSGRNGGTFTARLVDLPGRYVLGVVEDGGSDWDGNLPGSARDASGLYIVMNLSADCGVYGGKRKRAVWFRMDYPSVGRTSPAPQAGAPGALPARAPGMQGPFPVPVWNPCVPGWAAVDPAVMERVHVALVRL
jgi:serine/threonine-protein kinase RsbW